MKSSESINDLTKAMSEFQSKLTTLAKDTKAYNYRYTTLASIWESFRPLLGELGLFVFQDVLTTEEGVKVATRINHQSGQWMETDYILIPMGKRDAHSTGSAVSYGRRYSLSAALGIVSDEDDDGAKAMKAAPKAAPIAPPVKPFSDQAVENWYEKWDFEPDLVRNYCEARAEHKKHSINVTVAELASSENTFVKNMGTWLKQRELSK